MRVVIAPDSFKGSLTAKELCLAISEGIRRVYPDADIVALPLADGGEGTIDSMIYALGGEIKEVEVKDPLGRGVKACYGVSQSGAAIIEMAQASGLPRLSSEERNPLLTSSYGTGQLIRHCLDEGYRHILIGLGGSATNDAGMGMMKALGVRFLDSQGVELQEGGVNLSQLEQLDVSQMDSRISETQFVVVSDVKNRLCGEAGASYVFGPQKGASPDDVVLLDQALRKFGEIVNEELQTDVMNLPGSGAAGGMGASAAAFLKAEIRSGIDLILEYYNFDDHIHKADLLITGEGKLDSQTLSGKVISGVCKKASEHQVPVVALCGAVELASHQMIELGLTACLSIVRKPCKLDEAIAMAYEWSRDGTEQMMRLAGLKL